MTAQADRDDAAYRDWSTRRTLTRRAKTAHDRDTWVKETQAMAARMLTELNTQADRAHNTEETP